MASNARRTFSWSTGAPRNNPVNALHMALFHVFDPGSIEGPARLLAEVADGNGEQPVQKVSPSDQMGTFAQSTDA
jgi:hypothetical protein